jgi:tRNA(Ile)-lysidine synthase
MHPFEKDILAFIRNRKLITTQDGTVVVAVSGGPDSICLLHLLARLVEKLNITLVAAYVNHGLRPNETDQEQKLVRHTAEKMRCTCELGTVDVPGYAESHHLSIEHAARILRYNFLEKVAERYGADKIALAHTADDQAEELLLRLIRGTGRTGLAGMEAMRQERYIRPLLSTPKSRLLDYLHRNKIAFAHDSSNRQRIFLRNKIRLDLLPYLTREFNPNIQQTLLQTANILGEEEKLLVQLTGNAYKKIVSETVSRNEGAQPVPGAPTDLMLDIDRFMKEPMAIRRRVLEKAILNMANTPRYRQIAQLLSLAESGHTGNRIHLSCGLRAAKLAGRLHLSYPAGKTSFRGDAFQDDADDYFEIHISGPGRWVAVQTGLVVDIDWLDTPPPFKSRKDSCCEYFDMPGTPFPLTLRSPCQGDIFHPLGNNGRKKVSNFLIDNKVERARRWQTPVLISAGTVVALLGLRMDHHFRITSKTTRVLRVKWHHALSDRIAPFSGEKKHPNT